MRGNIAYKDEQIDFNRYLEFMHHQVEEIVTKYGKLDILWFDFSYGEMFGEKWKASDLIELVRKHQPDVVVDNRLETSGEGFGSIASEEIHLYSGDFVSPEQIVPHEGIRNVKGELLPWELCLTMNNHWAYNPSDKLYKSPKVLIRKLVECVSKGGNMILNVGPTAKGNFPQESIEILQGIGEWMKKNSESIYRGGFVNLPKPEWGYYTKDGKNLYAHVFEQPIGPIALTGIHREQIQRMSFVHDDSEVRISNSWTTLAFQNVCFAQYGEIGAYTYPLPDAVDSVIKIELKEEL